MTPRTERGARRVKRAIDLALCVLALPLVAPVAGVVALAVRLESRGPVLFRGTRVGRGGEPFSILKFRTMSVGAGGPGITGADDARVTRVGRRLRAAKLDELPQLLNVMRGEMSLVGPRPEDPRYVASYTAAQREVLRVPPGMTSAAWLQLDDEAVSLARVGPADVERFYLEELLPEKLALELAYLREWTPVVDLRILVRTLAAVLS